MTTLHPAKNFRHLKPGDKVTRLLGGKIRMPMLVREVDGDIITCDAIEENGFVFKGGWKFNADNGGEIDETLGWYPPRTPTGSLLVEDEAASDD